MNVAILVRKSRTVNIHQQRSANGMEYNPSKHAKAYPIPCQTLSLEHTKKKGQKAHPFRGYENVIEYVLQRKDGNPTRRVI